MTESLRDLKLRIRSITNTQKITRAMEMISSSKLSRVKSALFHERAYFGKLESMVSRLLSYTGAMDNPLIEKGGAGGKTAILAITSDAGLCSVYNYAMIRLVEDFVKNRGKEKVTLITVGREGYNHFTRHDYPIAGKYIELYGRYSDGIAQKLYNDMTGLFLKKEASEVYIAYTHFTSALRLKPTIEKFLEFEYKKTADNTEYIIEPDRSALIDRIVPAYLFEKVRLMLLEAFTSEHASRMIAMKMATDNAADLIDTLTLLRNKARQAAITKEILEVVMSAEALKG